MITITAQQCPALDFDRFIGKKLNLRKATAHPTQGMGFPYFESLGVACCPRQGNPQANSVNALLVNINI
jgi:hypothetical protein